ncbi:hypothetical protein ACWDFL_27395 [Streptomyces bungoensis]
MFSRQKIATVSGLVGTLAVMSLGGAHAYADNSPGDCKASVQGDTTCVRKSETLYKDKGGRYVIKQSQDCSTLGRPHLVDPEDGLMGRGSTDAGPEVECSNKTSLPKGFEPPHFPS